MSGPDYEVWWEAICDRCGLFCGWSLEDPSEDSFSFVVCIRCRDRGYEVIVPWERCELNDVRSGQGDAG